MPISRDPDTLRIPAFMRRRPLKLKEPKLRKVDVVEAPHKLLKSTAVKRKVRPAVPKMKSIPPRDKPARAKKIPSRRASFAPPIFEAPIFEAPKRSRPKEVGVITHYYDKIKVGVIKLSSVLNVGDAIEYKTPDGSFTQTVSSMEIERSPVFSAKRGAEIGIKLSRAAIVGSRVEKSNA